jgi:hypothetical protein
MWDKRRVWFLCLFASLVFPVNADAARNRYGRDPGKRAWATHTPFSHRSHPRAQPEGTMRKTRTASKRGQFPRLYRRTYAMKSGALQAALADAMGKARKELGQIALGNPAAVDLKAYLSLLALPKLDEYPPWDRVIIASRFKMDVLPAFRDTIMGDRRKDGSQVIPSPDLARALHKRMPDDFPPGAENVDADHLVRVFYRKLELVDR